jgi:hypothetical protein
MRWAPGGGGCVRRGCSARYWRGDGTGHQPSASAPAHVRRAATLVDDPPALVDDPTAGHDAQAAG